MKNQVNNSVVKNAVVNRTVINTNEVYNPVANAVVKAMKTFGKSKSGCKSGYIQIDGDVRLCFDGGYFVNPSNGKYVFIFNGKIQVKEYNGRYGYELVKVHVFISETNEINWNVQFNGVMNAIMEQIEKYNERIEKFNNDYNAEKTVDVVEENNTIENDSDINVSENMPVESMDFISPDILNDIKSITPMDIIKGHNIDEKGLKIKVSDIIPVEPWENINIDGLYLEIEKDDDDDDYSIFLSNWPKDLNGYSNTEFLYDNEPIYDAVIRFKKQWAETIIDRIIIWDDDTINIDAPFNFYKDDIDKFIELYNNNLLPDDIKFDADTRIDKELFEKYFNTNKNDNNMEILKEQIKDVCTYALLNGRYTEWKVVAETLNIIINENPNIPNEGLIETCKSLINKIVTYTSICGPFSELQIVDNLMRISKIYKIVDNWF